MSELWDDTEGDCELGYVNICERGIDDDSTHCAAIRRHCDELWSVFKPYADSHFLKEFPRNLDQRYWEMRLGCCLLQNGFEIRTQKKGPDFLLDIDGAKIWIEAITPTAGMEGSLDRVPDVIANGKAHAVPRDKIVLRFRHALHEKEQKFQKYVHDGLVRTEDVKIIALSSGSLGRGLPMSGAHPFILSAIFPLGNPYVSFDRASGRIVEQGNHYQPGLPKANGVEIDTLFFAEESHHSISAVIYSDADIGNPRINFGDDMLIIHNPMASAPLARGLFQFGHEYWVEESEDMWAIKHFSHPSGKL